MSKQVPLTDVIYHIRIQADASATPLQSMYNTCISGICAKRRTARSIGWDPMELSTAQCVSRGIALAPPCSAARSHLCCLLLRIHMIGRLDIRLRRTMTFNVLMSRVVCR